MALNPLNHYAMESPASIYDEEAMTALELAGRTAVKVNECVEAFNNHEEHTHQVIEEFKQDTSEDVAQFKQDTNEDVAQFKASVNDHIADQDQDIDEAVSYMKNNIRASTADELVSMRESGELDHIIEGSVFTSFTNRTAQFTTPQEYGAIGDGVADDTQAIQEALNTGKVVKLVPGTYKITSTLTVPLGVTITGDRNCVITPECETVFHLKEKTTLSGFRISVTSENVLTVFEINDESTTRDSMLEIVIENMCVEHSTKVMPEMYTVCHFHTNNEGLYNVTVRGCTFDNYPLGGYVARVYSEGDSWFSTIVFDGNYSRAFKWHYFFDKSDKDFVNSHSGHHIVTNCTAQCGPSTNGFLFIPRHRMVTFNNNITWDWGSDINGSINCKGAPIVIAPSVIAQASTEQRWLENNDLENSNQLCVYDGELFTQFSYNRHDIVVGMGGKYSAHIIPKYVGLSRSKVVRLYTDLYATHSRRRIRFYWCDCSGITYVSICIDNKKVFVSQPLDSHLRFGLSSDNKRLYVYMDNGEILPKDTGVMTLPVANSTTTFSMPESAVSNVEHTPNIEYEMDGNYFDALPEEVTECSIVLAQPAYVADENGLIYQLTVTTDENNQKVLSISRAWNPRSEIV